MTNNLVRRIAEWWNRPPAPACFDCGAPIIAADDDAMVCVQCGGRNRRLGARHPLRIYPTGRAPAPGTIVDLGPNDPTPIYPQTARHQTAAPCCAALTADQVRQIVREEIEEAMIPPWKRGNMGPG